MPERELYLPMKKWLLKAVAQKAVSYLPGATHINYLVHKHITFGKELPEDFFLDRLSHFTNHYRFLKEFHPNFSPELNILELGTGWHPIVPVAFFLSGHTDIITTDIRPQLYKHMVSQTLGKFIRFADENKLRRLVPDLQPEKLEILREVHTNALDIPMPSGNCLPINSRPRTVNALHFTANYLPKPA